MKKKMLLLMIAMPILATAQVRTELDLKTWQFSQDNTSWQQVQIPHDWAISGPFDKKWDLQTVRIEQNGEQQATEKSGRSGALPWIGEGWYKTTVVIPQGYEAAELVFDGAMAEPRVSINGKEAGYWAYGYNAFRVDATPFMKSGKLDISVHIQNVEESSRWYPGAGLFRPVKLVLTPKTHIDDWSLVARTLSVDAQKGANVTVDMNIIGTAPKMKATFSITDADGKEVAKSGSVTIRDGHAFASLKVAAPRLWSPETPYLYNVKAQLLSDGRVVDCKAVRTGIRTIRVSKEGGFQLNGITRKIKGVCLHHDLGPLGAAVNKSALARQILTMKSMGCDAIRTSHNMPSTWQMDLCDSLGMMVMAESFDMWIYPKCKNGYARFFREWSERDITNLVLNHRNHPSIVMWSIGNEIPEQWSEEGRQWAIRLQGLCQSLDPTRPVTQGMDRADAALSSGFAQAMQVPGLNYRLHKYAKAHQVLTHGFLLGSETCSTVSSRGVYKFPVAVTDKGVYADGQCSGYDVEYCPWSNLPDDDWRWQDDEPWVIGEFVWTGYDYLGEPTPYDEYWPSRSSYFGICDLAGLPKDRYYLYKSHWNKNEHTVHLLPHWTWGKDRIGQVTPVYCYTDGEEAELFVNGKSQGRIKKNAKERLDRYRLRWNNVKYEPGEIRVVAYDAQGNKIGEDARRTAGKASALTATAEPSYSGTGNGTWKADGEDLIFVRVAATDEKGTVVPDASSNLTFTVSGEAVFEAACNGDATSTQVFTAPEMQLFSGELVVILRTTKKSGTATLTVRDKSGKLKAAKLTVKTV